MRICYQCEHLNPPALNLCEKCHASLLFEDNEGSDNTVVSRSWFHRDKESEEIYFSQELELEEETIPTSTKLSVKDPLIGQALGNITLVEKLGQGGFGAVYKATHKYVDSLFAVKILQVRKLANETDVKRFKREGIVLAQLKHKNIVRFHDLGSIGSNGFYITMEYLQGESLQQELNKRRQANKPYRLAEVKELIGSLANALSHIHEKGLVHRDLKLSNIFLHKDEEVGTVVKLFDFGIAGLLNEPSELTETGTYLGTAKYVAPEQILASKKVDHRADLYSLGIILYQLITGRTPFNKMPPLEIVMAHLHKDPPRLREIRPARPWADELEAFLQKVLAKKAEDRPQSAKDFIGECEVAIDAQLDLWKRHKKRAKANR